MIRYAQLNRLDQTILTTLFTTVFTNAEGSKEGKLVGNLISQLSLSIDDDNIICYGVYEQTSLIGAIFLTRLDFSANQHIYLLAPVAIATEYQKQGIGQALIQFGINQLEKHQVEVLITYGDPAFYSKVGFEPLSEKTLQAPLKLSMPHGWLGQSLTQNAIPVIAKRPTCVAEFNDPVYW